MPAITKNKKPIILIVEDDSFLADIYKTKLAHEGYATALARDGEAALKAVGKQTPDLILLDILMPKMDGFEVLKRLKSDVATKKIKVIMLTNLGQKEDVDRGLELGADDYLIKAHFLPSETAAKVAKVLGT